MLSVWEGRVKERASVKHGRRLALCNTHLQRHTLQAHRCSHALLWMWKRESWPAKDLGSQPVPHLIARKFLLYVLNGLLSCSAVLMQPLWLSGDIPKPQYPFEKASGTAGVKNPLPVTLLPLPLRAQTSKASPGTTTCTGGVSHLMLSCFLMSFDSIAKFSSNLRRPGSHAGCSILIGTPEVNDTCGYMLN
jgi:hypothetical protein